jgi:hypothetical protein
MKTDAGTGISASALLALFVEANVTVLGKVDAPTESNKCQAIAFREFYYKLPRSGFVAMMIRLFDRGIIRSYKTEDAIAWFVLIYIKYWGNQATIHSESSV